MYKLSTTLLFICLIAYACGQAGVSAGNTGNAQMPLQYDTSKIAILPFDTANIWVFKNATPMQLTNADLQTVPQLLNKCIQAHNSKEDTTKQFSEYINLTKYRLQYVPYINEKGERRLYINGFCFYNEAEFAYWKKQLVHVFDGGSCFFQLTINLTTKKYERLFTNGYA